jgi:hypothetical protein
VVEREGLLEAVGRHVAGREQRPGIVGEDVDPRVALEQRGREPAHLVHAREVGDVLVDRARRVLGGRAHPVGVAADDRDLGAPLSQLDRRRPADPPGRARQDHGRHAVKLANAR